MVKFSEKGLVVWTMALKAIRSANGGGSTANEVDPKSDNKSMEVKHRAIREKKKSQICRVLLSDYNPYSKKKKYLNPLARAKRVVLCPISHCPTHFSLEKTLLSGAPLLICT